MIDEPAMRHLRPAGVDHGRPHVRGAFISMTEDQLHTAMDTEYALVPPRRRVLTLAARLSANTRVHHTATLRAVADGRVRPSMIHVLAWVR